MHYVYILYSAVSNRYYTGQTEAWKTRLAKHLSGVSPFTS
ncbi:MAG: GIY-YIG nuclease family protein [Verrucomicrobiota bacterium]